MGNRIAHVTSAAALVVSLLAMVFSMADVTDAQKKKKRSGKKGGKPSRVVRTNKRGKIPRKVVPAFYEAECNPESVDMGTWCIMSGPVGLKPEDAGKSNYFFATQRCVEIGGYLPTAGQLVGAAPRIKLSSTLDDSPLTASVDLDATDGLKDRREMSSTLTTTAAGGASAGSSGVSDGSTGDPRQGEPNPVPRPANPTPETLQYVTVYDNKDIGGFAGARPVTQPEQFRCAFEKAQGTETVDKR